MEACINPATRWLQPEKLEASPVRAGSSHALVSQYLFIVLANSKVGFGSTFLMALHCMATQKLIQRLISTVEGTAIMT